MNENNRYVIYTEPDEESYICINGIFSKSELLEILTQVEKEEQLSGESET